MPSLQNLLDEELIDLVAQNHLDAFEKIYDRYKYAMLAYASKRIPIEVAKDLVHDVFMNFWKNRKQIEFTDRISGYLFKSLRNIIIDYIAKNEREDIYINTLTDFALAYSYDSADNKLREEMFLKHIYSLLSNFNSQHKAIFDLRYQGFSNSEIAQKLGISEKTVRNKYSILTKYLKDKIPFIILLIFSV